MSTTDTSGNLQTAAQQIAAHYGIPWDVFNAQITQESGYDPSAVSSAGCIGIAQICDSVSFDPHDPFASLNYMAQRMSNAYAKYGDWGQALASYNCGDNCNGTGYVSPNASDWPAQTQAYVASILGGGNVPGGLGSGTGTSGGIPVQNLAVSQQTMMSVAVFGFLLIAVVAIAMRSNKKAIAA